MTEETEKPPRQPALVARDLREKSELFANPKSRRRHGSAKLALSLQRLQRELFASRKYWIRRVA